jgi:hypothetical protein
MGKINGGSDGVLRGGDDGVLSLQVSSGGKSSPLRPRRQAAYRFSAFAQHILRTADSSFVVLGKLLHIC